MQNNTRNALLAAVVISLSAATPVLADTFVPQTGSSSGVVVPNALPGREAPHPVQPNGHAVSPAGVVPRTGAAAGAQPPNSIPGGPNRVGEAQPHSDVLSPSGVVPQTGSAGGVIVPNAR